jgi:hypothetical protein
MKRTWMLMGLLLGAPVGAVESAADQVVIDEKEPEEVIIFGDRFARWDHTRWYAEMQIGFPSPFYFYAKENHEFRATQLQVRSAFLCDKTWKRGNRQFEVLCDIEEVSLRAVMFESFNEHVTDILTELDNDLTNAKLRLYVTDDGKIDNVDFEGFEANNRRELIRRENARQIFVRLMASFHMKLPRSSSMHEGQWVEYDSPLFLLPTPQIVEDSTVSRGGDSTSSSAGTTAPVNFASMGGSHVLNQLDKYKGQLVVQSVGKATISDGSESDESANYYSVKFDGVAIYDPNSGVMTERVYALRGKATASSALADGFGGAFYYHTGRVRMIEETTKVDVGPTGRSAKPNATATPGLLTWVPIE